jgi:hypothetical protein
MTVPLEGLSEPQRQSWRGLLDVAAALPHGWCVVGGQMVLPAVPGTRVAPARPIDDGDVVLDVRTHPDVLREFTAALTGVGFRSAGETPDGHQHRWTRELASIDVLIPQGLGRSANRRGVTGRTTLATPGAQQALARSEPVSVQVGETVRVVQKPNMLGALVAKAAAFSVPNDAGKERHLIDFAVLAAMARGSDRIGEQMTARDRSYLAPVLSALTRSRPLWTAIQDADRGVQAVAALATRPTTGRDLPTAASPEPPTIDL